MSLHAEVATKLREAVARLLGPPGDIFELRRLTAGATKATWAFTAQIGDTRQALVLQVSPAASASEDPSRGCGPPTASPVKLPTLAVKHDPAILLAAQKSQVPVPQVRAVLTEDCGMGEGCITNFVA